MIFAEVGLAAALSWANKLVFNANVAVGGFGRAGVFGCITPKMNASGAGTKLNCIRHRTHQTSDRTPWSQGWPHHNTGLLHRLSAEREIRNRHGGGRLTLHIFHEKPFDSLRNCVRSVAMIPPAQLLMPDAYVAPISGLRMRIPRSIRAVIPTTHAAS